MGKYGSRKTSSDVESPVVQSLTRRPRRNRRHGWIRRLVRQNSLAVEDLIWPVFLCSGTAQRQPIASMPGVARLSVDEARKGAHQAHALGIPAMALFPYSDADTRDDTASQALCEDNLVCQAIRAIKQDVPDMGIITDVALDLYTSHGHDGLMRQGLIDNDASVALFCQIACKHALAGADIIAPSDMMDGRVGAIRGALDNAGFTDVGIMAYTAKYASAFYSPFRDAVGSAPALKGDKRTYQMDPGNSDEAIMEARLDIDEGADMLMVKPGLAYLDIVQRLKTRFEVPLFAYQVSGEYAMICAAAKNGWLEQDAVMMESLLAFKRAGCDGILTYFALEAAELLRHRAV